MVHLFVLYVFSAISAAGDFVMFSHADNVNSVGYSSGFRLPPF